MPQRIQRKRTEGWRKPEGAVYVGRGSRWGNPFVVGLSYGASGLNNEWRRSVTIADRYTAREEYRRAAHWGTPRFHLTWANYAAGISCAGAPSASPATPTSSSTSPTTEPPPHQQASPIRAGLSHAQGEICTK